MISKEDYQDYLKQMFEVEETMRDVYSDCLDKVKDEKVRAVVTQLFEDEKKHVLLVKRLQEILLK